MPLPGGALSKLEIVGRVGEWLEGVMLDEDPSPVYVHLKQLELAVKTAIEKLNEAAFNDAGMKLGGSPSGTIAGQKVELSYPKRWEYSPAILALVEEQKTALDVAKQREQLDGLAKHVTGSGVIRVTIKAQ